MNTNQERLIPGLWSQYEPHQGYRGAERWNFLPSKLIKKLSVSRRGIRLQAYSWPGNITHSFSYNAKLISWLSYNKHVSLNLNFLANYAQLYIWDEIKRRDFMWGRRHSSSLLPHFQIYKLIQSGNIEKRCKNDNMSQCRLSAVDYNFSVSVWAVGFIIVSCWENPRSLYQAVRPFLRTITPVGFERFRIFLVKFH